jgi:hypothetical protein
VRRSVLEESHLATSEIVALFHRAITDDHSERFSVMLESSIRGFYEVAALKNTTLQRQFLKISWYVAYRLKAHFVLCCVYD